MESEPASERHLNLIADVDNESVWSRLHSDPTIISPDLETRHVLVGEEQRQASRVGVRGQAQSQVRLGAFWVEIYSHACSDILAPKRIL